MTDEQVHDEAPAVADEGADAHPARRPRRRRWLALRLSLLAMLVAAGLLLWAWHDLEQVLARPMPTGARPMSLTVEKGASLAGVARDLVQRGLLPSEHYLVLHGRRAGVATSLKAGEYVIDPGMTPADLLDRLVAGEVVQRAFTVIEGWTFRQLRRAVMAAPTLVSTLEGREDAEIMAALGAEGVHPEGRFLAETYHFPVGTTDLEFLRRAYRAMGDVLAEEWAARAEDLPFESADDALILASIVEKETAVAEERAAIAGVFVRRLRKGMRLQTDPTVIYGMGERFDGNIRRADLREDTPYNTYVHHGLPPTPIAMPGRAAIHAALHPSSGKALYFVARGDGTHHFSETYEEHRKAVVRYQIKRRRRGAASGAAGSG